MSSVSEIDCHSSWRRKIPHTAANSAEPLFPGNPRFRLDSASALALNQISCLWCLFLSTEKGNGCGDNRRCRSSSSSYLFLFLSLSSSSFLAFFSHSHYVLTYPYLWQLFLLTFSSPSLPLPWQTTDLVHWVRKRERERKRRNTSSFPSFLQLSLYMLQFIMPRISWGLTGGSSAITGRKNSSLLFQTQSMFLIHITSRGITKLNELAGL